MHRKSRIRTLASKRWNSGRISGCLLNLLQPAVIAVIEDGRLRVRARDDRGRERAAAAADWAHATSSTWAARLVIHRARVMDALRMVVHIRLVVLDGRLHIWHARLVAATRFV